MSSKQTVETSTVSLSPNTPDRSWWVLVAVDTLAPLLTEPTAAVLKIIREPRSLQKVQWQLLAVSDLLTSVFLMSRHEETEDHMTAEDLKRFV